MKSKARRRNEAMKIQAESKGKENRKQQTKLKNLKADCSKRSTKLTNL